MWHPVVDYNWRTPISFGILGIGMLCFDVELEYFVVCSW